MADQPIEYGQKQTLKDNTFTRTGYTFSGWATSATGPIIYEDKQSVSNLAATGSVITLYAIWEANTYTVKFNADGEAKTLTEEQNFTYDEEQALNANEFNRIGYTFLGWSTSANGVIVYTDEQAVKNLTDQNDVTLYAVWSEEGKPITMPTNDYGKDKAILRGYIDDSVDNIVEYGFYWGTSEPVDQIIVAEFPNITSAPKDYSYNLDGLECYSAYSYRAYVKTSDGAILQGDVISFKTWTLGDVNEDGKIGINDATIIHGYVYGFRTLTESQKKAADVNRDGIIDIYDATYLQRYIAKSSGYPLIDPVIF